MAELTLTPQIDGDNADDTLFFIQGWPDDATVWDSLVAELADTHRCVRVTLPNHGTTRDRRWGHTTEEIVGGIERCLREVSPDRSVTLVLHDWGCFWGHLLHERNPDAAHRIVTLDVAPHAKTTTALASIPYQWWLAFAFFLGGPVGDWMTRAFGKRIGAPAPRGQITAWMNYPYRNIWADVFRGRARSYFRDYWPELPILYLYGTKKPFMFHSQEWLDHVVANDGRVEALQHGHWVQLHPSFETIVTSWLTETV